MARNKINDLRDHLFEALEKLNDEKDKSMTIEKAEAIAKLGQVIVNSAKVEVGFLKVTGASHTESDLLKAIQGDKKQLPEAKKLRISHE